MENNILPYILPAASAVALVVYFFLRRGNLGAAAPAAGSVFNKFGVNVRLRDLFRLAVLLEEQGREFYLRMESKAVSPETKKLCAWLAEEEDKHRQFAQEHLSKWRPLGAHLTEWPAFLEKVKQEGFFAVYPPDTASEEEMAAFAIKQEAKSADFYRLFQQAFPEAWRRARLDRLVEEELSHEAHLRAAYPSVK